mgnify:CR=1 FL=1
MLDGYSRARLEVEGEDAKMDLAVADGPLKRARGLLGQRMVPQDQGLVLVPCESIHCLGMSCTIDVVYVRVEDWREMAGTVILSETVRPGRIGTNPRGTSMVVELARGAAERAGLAPGVRVVLARA